MSRINKKYKVWDTESYFIAKSMKWLKHNTDVEVIVSFADQHLSLIHI